MICTTRHQEDTPPSEYQFVTNWLKKKPDLDRVVTYIKQQMEHDKFTPIELDALRSRVIAIKNIGYDAYLEQERDPKQIALQIFEGSREVD